MHPDLGFHGQTRREMITKLPDLHVHMFERRDSTASTGHSPQATRPDHYRTYNLLRAAVPGRFSGVSP